MSETTEIMNKLEQSSEIQEKDIPQEEKAFLTDTSTKTVWMKTKTGKDFLKMNYIEMLAKNAYPIFAKLKHTESTELFGFKYTYYDQTDQQGNKVPDGVGSVYRYPKGAGGGKPQFKQKYSKEVYQGLTEDTNKKLAEPNGKWIVVGSHWDVERRETVWNLHWFE